MTDMIEKTELQKNRTASTAHWALRDMAANILRLVGGAGDTGLVVSQMGDFFVILREFHEVHGRAMSGDEIAAAFRLPDAKGNEDHAYKLICTGAMRLAAHDLRNETPVFGGKFSTDVINRGIEQLERAKSED